MAAARNLPSNFYINPFASTPITNSELRIGSLFLHYASRQTGPTQPPTQPSIELTHATNGFGTTIVSNKSAIYNGPEPTKDAVVAHVHSLYVQSDNWHNSFTIAFEIDGLKGSTLQVMGLVENSDQWSIIGGTGQFTLAQGFIDKRLHKIVDTGSIIELNIYAIYRPAVKKNIRYGPRGANEPINREPEYEPRLLESLKIRHNDFICAFEYTYIDQTNTKRTDALDGYETSNKTDTVELGPTEFVKEISGTIGTYKDTYTVITSLTIVTNLRTLGPYGKRTNNAFTLPEKKEGRVVGFFGKVGAVVDSVGVIMRV